MSFRIRYFLSHLILSFIVGCLTAATVYWVWYPGVLAKAIGVSHIFLLLLCIDITVGPILTLFLAKEGKKGLWFDLVTVVIIQFVALIYGIWHIAEGRPAWKTLNIYRVELVKAIDMDYTNAKAPFSHSPWGKPQWVMVRPAKDKQETSDWIWKTENHRHSGQSCISRLKGTGRNFPRKCVHYRIWENSTRRRQWMPSCKNILKPMVSCP